MQARTRRRRVAAAIAVSLLVHVALVVVIGNVPVLAPVASEPIPVEIFLAERFPAPAPVPVSTPAVRKETGGGEGVVQGRESEGVAGFTPSDSRLDSPSDSPSRLPAGRTITELIDETFRRERFREGRGSGAAGGVIPGAPGTAEGKSIATDSIDGIARLGSGQPGDPRIPGSGNVDIVAVITRDGVVNQAQERAREGQVHPFLAQTKENIEDCWLPVQADAALTTDAVRVTDNNCAVSYHLRRRVGRVFVVYDASGRQLSMYVHGGSVQRGLRERVRKAIETAGMKEVPPELLDREGTLRLAWNVYIDDFSDCGLIGRGANAHKPGGDLYIGIVELDGMY